MLNQIFALQVIYLMLLKFQPMSQADNLEPVQEESEQSFIKDLLVFRELVFHDCVDEEHDTLFVQMLLVSKVVLAGVSGACTTLTIGLCFE